MSIFLGKSECFRHGNRDIISIKAGPGGLVVGCLSRHRRSIALELSLWIVVNGGLRQVESLSLPRSPQGDSDKLKDGSVIWHSTGNSIYVLTGSHLYLVAVEYGDLYQGNRQVSLAEFYSLFLGNNLADEELETIGVNLRLIHGVANTTTTTLFTTFDRKFCLYCTSNTSPQVILATHDFKTLKHMQLSSPRPEMVALTVHASQILSLLPLCDAMPVHVSDGSLSASGKFHMCDDKNSLQITLGYSQDSIFLVQQQGDQPCDFTGTFPIRITVSAAAACHCDNVKHSVQDNDDNFKTLLEDFLYSDDDQQEESDEWSGERGLDGSGGERICELDEESHGNAYGKIRDVICFEPNYNDADLCKQWPQCVYYTALLEHVPSEASTRNSFELICIAVQMITMDENSDHGSFSFTILSRKSVADVTADDEKNTVYTNPTTRLQCIRSENNAPIGLLVCLRRSIQCIGVCVDGLQPSAGVDDLNIYDSTLFSLDLRNVMPASGCITNVSYTVAANYIFVATSWTDSDSPTTGDYSFIYLVSLISSNPRLSEFGNLARCAINGALVDLSQGVVMLPKKNRVLSGSDVDNSPGRGKSSFSTAIIPPPLKRDVILNRCKFKYAPKVAFKSYKSCSVWAIEAEYLLQNDCSLNGGLIFSVVECDDEESRGYLASALSVSPLTAHLGQAGVRHRGDLVSNHSYVWIQSTVTSKWKILSVPDSPSLVSVSLLTYLTPSLRSVGTRPGKVFSSRKHYTEKKNSLVGILNIGWFKDHSVFMCTIRKQSSLQLPEDQSEGFSVHCCLEVMSRASERTESVTVEHNKYRNGRRDLRRLSTPNTHKVVPLPTGFVPVVADCFLVSPDYSPIDRKERSMSMSSVGTNSSFTEDNLVMASSSCVVLVGSSCGHFLLFQVTATSHNDSLTGDDVSAKNFKPSKYGVKLVWQCDVSSASISPALDTKLSSIKFPLRSVHVMPSEGQESDYGMLILDSAGQVIKVIVDSFECEVLHESCGSEKSDETLKTFKQINRKNVFFICTAECATILRLCDYNNSDTNKSGSYFSRFGNNTFLMASLGGEDDMLLLASPQDGTGSEHGNVMRAPVRMKGSVLVDRSSVLHGICWCYANPIRILPAPCSIEDVDEGVSDSILTIQSSAVTLDVVLGLLNVHESPVTRFGTKIVVRPYKYHHSAVEIIGSLITNLRLKSVTLLSQLADGLEIHLKSIIQQRGFTRHSPDFAIMTTALFAADDFFFVDIFSKLARKLEPHVSFELFPLPNCQISYISPEFRSKDKLDVEDEHEQGISNTQLGKKYVDSFWDQLSLFEMCLQRKWLSLASRFLTIACEYLGGSQSLETVTGCLIIATELLYESLRNLSLETALECLDFCVRLDMMAVEIIAQEEASLESIRNLDEASSRLRFVKYVKHEVVGFMGMLSPLLGSDLHDVMEDVIEPLNVRNRVGLMIYNRHLYVHSKLKFRVEKSEVPSHVCLKTSSQKYFAFCASNRIIQQQIQLMEMSDNDHCEDSTCGIEGRMGRMSSLSYSGTVVHNFVRAVIASGKWMCASVTMSSIQQHCLNVSKTKVSWIEESLYIKSIDLFTKIGNDDAMFDDSRLSDCLKHVGIDLALKMCPSYPLDHDLNNDMRDTFLKELSEQTLRGKCQMEMNDSNIFVHSAQEVDGHSGSLTSVQFNLPEGSPGYISMINLLQGTACAALLTGCMEIVIFISILLCRRDITEACLRWDDDIASRRFVTKFFLSRGGRDEVIETIPLSDEKEALVEGLYGDEILTLRTLARRVHKYYKTNR